MCLSADDVDVCSPARAGREDRRQSHAGRCIAARALSSVRLGAGGKPARRDVFDVCHERRDCHRTPRDLGPAIRRTRTAGARVAKRRSRAPLGAWRRGTVLRRIEPDDGGSGQQRASLRFWSANRAVRESTLDARPSIRPSLLRRQRGWTIPHHRVRAVLRHITHQRRNQLDTAADDADAARLERFPFGCRADLLGPPDTAGLKGLHNGDFLTVGMRLCSSAWPRCQGIKAVNWGQQVLKEEVSK